MEKEELNINNEDRIKFMLAEFNSSWDMLQAIDNRRGVYFNYYNAMFIAIIGLSFGFIDKIQGNLFSLFSLSLVFGFMALLGYRFRLVIDHENEANNRYKNKINLIRELFLSDSGSSEIDYYLQSQKHTGVRLYKCRKFRHKHFGPSINNLRTIIHCEIIVSGILSIILLIQIFLCPCKT